MGSTSQECLHEVLGPFICCLLASLVFFSDVFLYIVERACAWMVWDEFAELEEKAPASESQQCSNATPNSLFRA